MVKELICYLHQIQTARMYLFLYFSSFFCLSNEQRLKTCFFKIVSTYLWWLLPGVCELCSLSAIFGTVLLYFQKMQTEWQRWCHMENSFLETNVAWVSWINTVPTGILKIGVKLQSSRKTWSFVILFCWDFAKNWSQRITPNLELMRTLN